MREIREMVLVGVILLLGCGCASRPAEQVSVTGAGGATGAVAAPVAVQPPFPGPAPDHSQTMFTAMAPRDAAMAAARALYEKFGLSVGSGGTYYQGYADTEIAGDHFSSSANAQSTNGKSIEMTFEWLKDGETKVELSSNFPSAQYDAVVAVIRSAIGGTDKE